MFNIGFSEMILIGIIALIFLPPEKLPEVATKLGRLVGQITRNFAEVKTAMEQGMKAEVTNKLKKIPNPETNAQGTEPNQSTESSKPSH